MKIIPILLFLLLVGCREKNPYSYIAPGTPPESFEIINISDTSVGIDGSLWIKAKVEEKSIDTIIKSGAYGNEKGVGGDMSLMNPPEWWKPEEDGHDWEHYEKERYHPKHTDILQEVRALWIDRDSGILYFVHASF